jgi:uncharacterized protein (TIGR00369 family)
MLDESVLRDLAATTMPSLLGVEFDALAPECVRGRIGWRPEITADGALFHGGAIMAFADMLGAFGAGLNLPDGAITATLESKTNFCRGARSGELTGEAVPLHIGRHAMVWQTTVRQGDKLIAQTTQTQIVIQQ